MERGDQRPWQRSLQGSRKVVGPSVSLSGEGSLHPGVAWSREGGLEGWGCKPQHNLDNKDSCQGGTARGWQGWGLLVELVLKLGHPPVTRYDVLKSALGAFCALVDQVGLQDRGSQGTLRPLLMKETCSKHMCAHAE